jgi:hypothetical protein
MKSNSNVLEESIQSLLHPQLYDKAFKHAGKKEGYFTS